MSVSLLGTLFTSVADTINKWSDNSTNKEKMKEEISLAILSSMDELARAQRDTVLAEARGTWLQRSWRPIVMLTFCFMVLLGTFIEIPALSESSPFWDVLEMGLGGYVIGRSAEKISSRIFSHKT
jgi:hypothetical protein